MTMTTEDHLLVIGIEECVEVAKKLSKILRFGPNDIEPGQLFTARERAQQEIYDLLAALDDLDKKGIVPIPPNELAVRTKQLKVQRMLEYSRDVGRLKDDHDDEAQR